VTPINADVTEQVPMIVIGLVPSGIVCSTRPPWHVE
jgi:hypothetical protein